MELVKIETQELQALEKSKAKQIKETFEPMVKMLSDFESAFNEIVSESKNGITKEVTIKAKRCRLDIGKVRIETGKLKDKQKEYLKLEDRAIMGVHNILVFAVKEKEDKLKEIEDHFETLERQRLEKLQSDRAEQLSKYLPDAFEINLSSMDEDVWNAYFETKKKEYEDKQKTLEERNKILRPYIVFIRDYNKMISLPEKEFQKELAGIKKAAEDQWEFEREEVVRIQNEKNSWKKKFILTLKEMGFKEDEGGLSHTIHQYFIGERHYSDLNQEEFTIECAKVKKYIEDQDTIKSQREEAKKLADQLKAKEEAERKAKQDEEARIQSELNKGDSDKLKDLVNDLKSLKTKYQFKSDKNIKMYSDVNLLIDKVINHIHK